jgi:hypothetical protein
VREIEGGHALYDGTFLGGGGHGGGSLGH